MKRLLLRFFYNCFWTFLVVYSANQLDSVTWWFIGGVCVGTIWGLFLANILVVAVRERWIT